MENMINELNIFLSDLNVFYRKLQNYHWNAQGKDFFRTHEKLEELYNEVNESIDEIAEHILILGGQPLGTLKDYLATSTIQEAENKKVKSDEIYSNLITDFETLLKTVLKDKKVVPCPACSFDDDNPDEISYKSEKSYSFNLFILHPPQLPHNTFFKLMSLLKTLRKFFFIFP